MNLNELTQMYDFTGKTVAITGGAGILGGEMACALVGCNANVAILDRDPKLAERFLHRIPTSRGRASVIYTDVLNKDVLNQTAETVIKEFGKIDFLINAAGGNKPQATTGKDSSFFDLPKDASAIRFRFEYRRHGLALASIWQTDGTAKRRCYPQRLVDERISTADPHSGVLGGESRRE